MELVAGQPDGRMGLDHTARMDSHLALGMNDQTIRPQRGNTSGEVQRVSPPLRIWLIQQIARQLYLRTEINERNTS